MGNEQFILIITRLAFGAAATFLAIMLWSKTRDAAWIFVVLGTITGYGDIVFNTLNAYGIIRSQDFQIIGVSISSVIFTNLPFIFYGIAFIILLRGLSDSRSKRK